ncbi:MAG: Uma2 family endonuclease [Steroidobacteraceae bacterium]
MPLIDRMPAKVWRAASTLHVICWTQASTSLQPISSPASGHFYTNAQANRMDVRHGVPEYWIVDVVKPALHLFHSPQGERYLRSSSTPRPGPVALRALPELKVDLTGLFELL